MSTVFCIFSATYGLILLLMLVPKLSFAVNIAPLSKAVTKAVTKTTTKAAGNPNSIKTATIATETIAIREVGFAAKNNRSYIPLQAGARAIQIYNHNDEDRNRNMKSQINQQLLGFPFDR